jgi:hypothetical protein
MLGWLHPYAPETGRPTFFDNGEVVPDSERLDEVREHLARCDRMRLRLAQLGFQSVEWDRAYHVSEAAKDSLLPRVENEEYCPAELVHFFDALPSPANLAGRTCIYVQMWALPGTPGEAQGRLHELAQSFSGNGRIFLEAKRAPKANACFLLASVEFRPPHESSTKAFVEQHEAVVHADLDALRSCIIRAWPSARLATREFWVTEIGLFA